VTIDLQPTLQGKLLTLRPMLTTDWTELFATACDPLIWEVHPFHDRWKEHRFRSYFDEGMASGGALVAVDNANGNIIGCSRFANHAPELREIEIGWTFLARNYWGGTYNREMKSLMLIQAFRYFDSVRFNIGAGNVRSRGAIEKIGARLDGEYMVTFQNREIPHVIYRINKEEAKAAGMI
jgi:N-acetyltransferase